jgi:NADH dehydrogenase
MGAFSGLVGSVALIHIVANTPLSVLCGVMAGTCYSLCFFNRSESLAESVITGSALGIPLWMLLSIIVSPGIAGQSPQWTPHGMQQKLPELVGWMFYGAGLGVTIQTLNRVSPWRIRTEPPSTPQVVEVVKTHIVIVGGGFAGMHTAATLEELFGPDPSVSITLVSDTASLLFTPMLSEVAGGNLEPTHISTPLRTALRRTEIVRSHVNEIQLGERRISLRPKGIDSDDVSRTLSYDHLVFALDCD